MSDPDNLADYADALAYDLENAAYEPDGPLFLALAQRIGGPVLDLGCGTGRITIPLAQRGIDITGVDLLPRMLARARTKAGDLPIRWVQADARTLDLDTQFGVIFESGALPHMLTLDDQEAMLARVREHLLPSGAFALCVDMPRAALVSDSGLRDWYSYANADGQTVHVSGTYEYDPVKQISVETAHRRWRDGRGQEIVTRTPLAHRLFFPQEIEMLLHYNGFRDVESYGSFDFGPLDRESEVMIYLCRPAA